MKAKAEKHGICDIIMSMPWQCGDKDCDQQWHQSNYWINGSKYTVDQYGDGDHESIDKSDLPTADECSAAWLEYSHYVAKHGVDPLGEFLVRPTRKIKERWQFRFTPTIVGLRVLHARHAGKIYWPTELPKHIREFLNLKNEWLVAHFKTAKEAEKAGIKIGPWHSELITREVENKSYRRQLVALARKDIARGEAR